MSVIYDSYGITLDNVEDVCRLEMALLRSKAGPLALVASNWTV
jgi:hypothetical protein